MKDQELFELCKQVYEATGWKDDSIDYYMRFHKPAKRAFKVNRWEYDEDSRRYHGAPAAEQFREENEVAPLYTSDYLLEKLPVHVDDGVRVQNLVQEVETYYPYRQKNNVYSAYYKGSDFNEYSDTPLKALLKLTIALHKENLL